MPSEPAQDRTWRAPSSTAPEGSSRLLPERYEDLGLIAEGGMGEVRRVYDRHLERVLAMKILAWQALGDAEARGAFWAESRLTAQLQHPNIVPVHDRGELADGRLWFTMREVVGRTLGEALAQVHAPGQDLAAAPAALRRLVGHLEDVAQAVAYAHGLGVVHRDLKPANVVLGPFGEVLVLDWGVAVAGVGHGIVGTPAWMAPEQALGAAVGPAADVYALGALLYAALCGQPPYASGGQAALLAARAGPPPDLAGRIAAGRPAPEDLLSLCHHAMARDPAARPSAPEVAAALRAWLDGERRSSDARALLGQVDHLRAEVAARAAEAQRHAETARSLSAEIRPSDPVALKQGLWSAEASAAQALAAQDHAELALERVLRAALELAPELGEARDALAQLYRDRVEAAEARQDEAAARRDALLLTEVGRGRHQGWLQGDGALSLRTDPPDAQVQICRYEERDRRLVEVPVLQLRAPLDAIRLPRGSYVAHLSAPGRAPVALPFLLGRQERWDQAAPGEAPAPVRLPLPEELGPDDVTIPAGWALLGGDPLAADPLPRQRVWMEAYVLRRQAVSVAEYAEFLSDRVASGDERAWRDYNPPLDPADASVGAPRIFALRDGAVVLGADLPPWAPRGPDHPMAQLNARCADALAAWQAARTGLPWRLPTEWERERAARGADGRTLPWGDHFEPTWAAVLESFPGPPMSLPLSARPLDVSPYGVLGLCGFVRDLCANAYSRLGPRVDGGRAVWEGGRDAPYRAVRGGSWRSAAYLCRPAGRFGAPPDAWSSATGMRLARSVLSPGPCPPSG